MIRDVVLELLDQQILLLAVQLESGDIMRALGVRQADLMILAVAC